MLIEFSTGKIIATQYEVSVRIHGEHMVTLQAQIDALKLIGNGANVILANAGDCRWSVKLDNEAQLLALSQFIGITW